MKMLDLVCDPSTIMAIPFLFLRFFYCLEACALEKFIVLISKECPYFGHMPFFVLFFAKMSKIIAITAIKC